MLAVVDSPGDPIDRVKCAFGKGVRRVKSPLISMDCLCMSDWTAGYVADIGYTFGYYTESATRQTNI